MILLVTFLDNLQDSFSYTNELDEVDIKDHVDYRVRPKITEGVLKKQLIDRIDDSFCYTAFVGKGFLDSKYCNVELDYIFNSLRKNENKTCYFFALNKNSYQILLEKIKDRNLPDRMIHKLYKEDEYDGLPMDDVDTVLQREIIKDIRNSMIDKIKESVIRVENVEKQILLKEGERTYGKPDTGDNLIKIFINENENDVIDIQNYLEEFKNEHFPDKRHMRIHPVPLDDLDQKQLALINEYADGVILSGSEAINDETRKKILDQEIYQIMVSTMNNKGSPVSGFVLLKNSNKQIDNREQTMKTLWQVFEFIFDPDELPPGEIIPREVKTSYR